MFYTYKKLFIWNLFAKTEFKPLFLFSRFSNQTETVHCQYKTDVVK